LVPARGSQRVVFRSYINLRNTLRCWCLARARGVSRSLFSLAGSTHPLSSSKGGGARERLVWWEPTSSGAAQLRHNGPRSADVTGSCNWTADYQTAVRSGQHPDFLDFANRQPAATVSSGCQGPIIRLQRQIGDTCGRTRAQASLAACGACPPPPAPPPGTHAESFG